jgi:hypothetical protein
MNPFCGFWSLKAHVTWFYANWKKDAGQKYLKKVSGPDTQMFVCDIFVGLSAPVADDSVCVCEALSHCHLSFFRTHHWKQSVLIVPQQLSCSTNEQGESGHKYTGFPRLRCLSFLLHVFTVSETNLHKNSSHHIAERARWICWLICFSSGRVRKMGSYILGEDKDINAMPHLMDSTATLWNVHYFC